MSLKKSRLILTVLAVTATISGQFCQALAKEPLKAGVEHAEKLPAVDKTLLPGAAFKGEGEKETRTGEWVRIPAWLAGGWQADKETATLRRDIKSGREAGNTPFTFRAKVRFSYGMQKDLSGGIWHYVSTPYTSATDLPEFIQYHNVRSKKFTSVADDKVSITTLVTVARVGRQSRLIEEVFQQESITSYSPLSDGFIKMVASTKTYDIQGNPMLLADNEAKIERVEPFSPVDTKDGQDIKKLFISHLNKIGYGHLAPAGLRAKPL